jgi:type II secretory pathway component PulJ
MRQAPLRSQAPLHDKSRHRNDGRSRRNSFAILFYWDQPVPDPGISNEVARVHRIGFYLFRNAATRTLKQAALREAFGKWQSRIIASLRLAIRRFSHAGNWRSRTLRGWRHCARSSQTSCRQIVRPGSVAPTKFRALEVRNASTRYSDLAFCIYCDTLGEGGVRLHAEPPSGL